MTYHTHDTSAILDIDLRDIQDGDSVVWDNGKLVPGSGAGGGATTVKIAQTAHGLNLLDCIRWDGSSWVKAQADDINTLALGVVVSVTDPDNFEYAMSGRFEAAHGLEQDEWFFLSAVSAGDVTPTEPPISQPIIVTDDANHFSVYPYRPSYAGENGVIWELVPDGIAYLGNGNVGIGTDEPQGSLSVKAQGRVVTIGDSGAANVPVLKSRDQAGTGKAFLRYDAYAHYFWVNKDTDSSSMVISDGGQVGINCLPGTNLFRIQGQSATSSTYSCVIRNGDNDILFATRDDGAVRMDTVSTSFPSSNAANVYLASNGFLYKSTSSRRYKREIADMPYGLAEALSLRPVIYKGTGPDDGEKIHGGMIAEEVHEAGLTDFVEYNEENEPESLEYSNMVALAFKAIQELTAQVTELKAEVAHLKAKRNG